jgi:hypothetical protein
MELHDPLEGSDPCAPREGDAVDWEGIKLAYVEGDRSRLTGTISHEIALRYRAGVVPAMRFRKGTRVFHILAVIDVEERKRWLKCLCEEREL